MQEASYVAAMLTEEERSRFLAEASRRHPNWTGNTVADWLTLYDSYDIDVELATPIFDENESWVMPEDRKLVWLVIQASLVLGLSTDTNSLISFCKRALRG